MRTFTTDKPFIIMKRFPLILALVALSATAFAQQPSVDERAEKRTQAISDAVSLTPQQYAQVRQVFVEAFTKIDALDRNNSRDALQEQRQAIMRDTKSQLQSILTSQQQEQLRKQRQAQNPDRQKRRQ